MFGRLFSRISNFNFFSKAETPKESQKRIRKNSKSERVIGRFAKKSSRESVESGNYIDGDSPEFEEKQKTKMRTRKGIQISEYDIRKINIHGPDDEILEIKPNQRNRFQSDNHFQQKITSFYPSKPENDNQQYLDTFQDPSRPKHRLPTKEQSPKRSRNRPMQTMVEDRALLDSLVALKPKSMLSERPKKLFRFRDWRRLLRKECRESVCSVELRKNVRDSFINQLRPRIWDFLCGRQLSKIKKLYPKTYYQILLTRDLPDKVNRDIEKDVMRTFIQHPGFDSEDPRSIRTAMRRVLQAYCAHDKELGYVQGMNFIAAGIVASLHPSKFDNLCFSFGKQIYKSEGGESEFSNFEESAFWLMVYIFDCLHWREVFGKNFSKLRSLFGTFEDRLKALPMNSSMANLREIGVGSFDIFSPCFYSLMLNKFPLEYHARVLDIFFLESEAGILDLLVRILLFAAPQISHLSPNPDQLLTFLQEDLVSFVSASHPSLFSFVPEFPDQN